MFCSYCGKKIPKVVVNNFSKHNLNINGVDSIKETNLNECITFEVDETSNNLIETNEIINNFKSKKKSKLKIMICTILSVIIIGTIIGIIGYKCYKNNIENIVPNYFLSFGSIGVSTNNNTGEKKFEVDVTAEVELYELSIDVYIYEWGKYVDSFNYTQNIEVGTSTTKVEIIFEKQEYYDLRYDFIFYGTGKTHEKLPNIDYASIFFMNYDDTVYDTFMVEKDYGKVWELPNAPIRYGYIFDGWYYDKNYSKKFDITEQYWRDKGQDLKLYPKWSEA